MADFVQTMKDWKRMCMAMEKLRPDDSCCGCPLEGYGCPAIYEEDSSHVDYADIEKNVTAWAAEHPEPVYPTWEEWLSDKYNLAYNDDFRLAMSREPIPADIAQKLGIHPVPIVHGDCGATNAEEARKKLGIEPKEGI